MDALISLKEKEKKGKKKSWEKISKCKYQIWQKIKKIKTMIDFNKRESNSIQSIAVNSSTVVDVSTRYCKGKMLMFAKMSIK